MRNILFLWSIILGSCLGASAETTPNVAKDALQNSRQMILVTTKNWDSVSGVLQRFDRAKTTDIWREVDLPIAIVVGRNGMAWGRGLHGEIKSAPQKKEGDGKSPAGIFRLSSAFGIAPPSEMNLKMPYQQLTDAIECVDDVKSERYNSIVDSKRINHRDWDSSEKMLGVGEQYRLGVVVDHNADPRNSGSGSCIFLHIWKGDGSGTSGCTAMAKSEMEKLISWLDANANPVLVQFPEPEFKRLKSNWNLPAMKTSRSK